MTEPPLVSIIVPCRNEADFIDMFVRSVFAQGYPNYEVIIADGESDDGTQEKLHTYQKCHPDLIVVPNPDKYVSKGLNAAIRIAQGAIVVRMDIHTEYAEDYVEQCVQALESTGAGNVGGPACTRSNSFLQKAVSMAYHSPFAVGGARFHNVNYEGYVDTVTYGCWYKSTLEEIGLFDEELIRNQDDELNLRLIRAGRKVWQTPRIRSWYYPRSSLLALFRQYMQYGYWKVRVIQKHRIPASFRHLVPGLFVGGVLVLSMLAPFHQFFAIVLAGVLGLYLGATILATVMTCLSNQLWQYGLILPVIFMMYHIGYGFGFLRGLVDFNLMKSSSESFHALTRKKRK